MIPIMKHTISVFLSAAALLVACNEDFIGQYPVDNVAPAPVSDVRVENLPGSAMISYSLPNETDLLYVKAVYTDSHGTRTEVKSSVFKDNVVLKGFGRSKKQTVQLITVDSSENESAPVSVEIEPEDSPIYSIMESMDVFESWGGFKMTWSNPQKEQIIMYVYQETPDGYVPIETIASSMENGETAIRGLAAEPTGFQIQLRDIYDNYTETLSTTLTPLYEMQLPGNKMTVLPLPTGAKWSGYSTGNLFDDVITSDKPVYLDPNNPQPQFMSIGFNGLYKLSRVRFWGRVKYCYGLHNPRHFQFWGTADDAAGNNPNTFDGWTLILDDWSIKPSGLNPDGTPGTVTAEDQAYAEGGEEYEIPESVPPIKYFRMVCLQTWSNSKAFHLNELRFWGQEKD